MELRASAIHATQSLCVSPRGLSHRHPENELHITNTAEEIAKRVTRSTLILPTCRPKSKKRFWPPATADQPPSHPLPNPASPSLRRHPRRSRIARAFHSVGGAERDGQDSPPPAGNSLQRVKASRWRGRIGQAGDFVSEPGGFFIVFVADRLFELLFQPLHWIGFVAARALSR